MAHHLSSTVSRTTALFEPLALPLYVGLGLVWAALLVLAPISGIYIDHDLLLLWLPAGIMIWFALVLRARKLKRLAEALECWTLLNIICFSSILLSFWIARVDAPYVDATLDALERLAIPAFDWQRDVVVFSKMPVPLRLANFAYESIKWQPTLLIVILCSAGLRTRCWTFLLAWTLSLSGTIAIFAAAPAIGAYGFHHIPHEMVGGIASQVGWRQPLMLELLRNGLPITIQPRDFVGIVEFPSFHTASAVLLCWAFWPVRWARCIALPLNAGMIVACVPIGGHYLLDVVAGTVVAIAGIMSARAYHDRRNRIGTAQATGCSAGVTSFPVGILAPIHSKT